MRLSAGTPISSSAVGPKKTNCMDAGSCPLVGSMGSLAVIATLYLKSEACSGCRVVNKYQMVSNIVSYSWVSFKLVETLYLGLPSLPVHL